MHIMGQISQKLGKNMGKLIFKGIKEIYDSNEGSPMGKSILGVICCINISVANFEKVKISGNISLIYKRLFQYRFDDDVLYIWEPGIKEADNFLDFLNSENVKSRQSD